MRILLALLLVTLLVAGCVGPESAAKPQTPRRAVVAMEREAAPDPARLVSNTTVEFNRTGEAGSWYVAFLEFSASSGSVMFRSNFSFVAAAPADGANAVLVFPPGPVQEGGGGWLPGFFTRGVTRYSNSQEPVEITYKNRSSSSSSGGRPMTGILIAVASTGPWTLEGNVTMVEGAEFVATREAAGSGVQIFLGETSSTPGGAGMLTLDATIPSTGWSHYQLFFSPLQPVGVRDQNVVFPDGRTFAGTSSVFGYYNPASGGSAYGGHPGAIGTFKGSAGAFHAEVTFAEPSTALRQVLFHVSMDEDQMAGAGTGYYEASADPFRGNCFGC